MQVSTTNTLPSRPAPHVRLFLLEEYFHTEQLCSGCLLSFRHTAAKMVEEKTMAQQAAAHHTNAVEYHEQAAHHHREASKHYGAHQHAQAAHHAHLAQGHNQQAIHHGTDAAKAHGEHHGVAEQIMKDGGCVWRLKPW